MLARINSNGEQEDDEEEGSIHDLDAAPEAPDSASSLFDFSIQFGNSPSVVGNSPHHHHALRARSFSSPLTPGGLPHVPGLEHDDPRQHRRSLSLESVGGGGGGKNEDDLTNQTEHRNRLNSAFSDFDEDEDETREHKRGEAYSSNQPLTLLGIRMPACCNVGGPGCTRLSSFLVRNAPCFWCCGQALEVGATDRSILYRLNHLIAFFSLGQIGAALFLVLVLYAPLVERDLDQQESASTLSLNLWNINGSVFFNGIMACVVFFTVTMSLRVIREVNLRGALRYMWTLVWVLPLQIFFAVSLFDPHQVTEVWVKHWWLVTSMAWFRSEFCADGTFNTLCMVPVNGGPRYGSEAEWCQDLYAADNCTAIRDEAQKDMIGFTRWYYYSLGIWALMSILLLILAIKVLEQIITKPIIQNSRESNVPAWLTFPVLGCSGIGVIFLFSPTSVLSRHTGSDTLWIGVLYIICAGCFFVAGMLGWFIGAFSILNSRDKRNKNIAVIAFIGITALTALLVASIIVGSILLSLTLVDLKMSDSERGDIACLIDSADSCSFCANRLGLRECPEWTSSDVTKILRTQLKQSATLGAIFILYALGALRFGVSLKGHISMYQIDYV